MAREGTMHSSHHTPERVGLWDFVYDTSGGQHISPRARGGTDHRRHPCRDDIWGPDLPTACASGFTGPLHCIPVIVKDNYDTFDLPTTAGSLSLKDTIPPDDAFQVRKLREAGALVLAKSNMAEFAWSPYETVNSVLPGYTRNPYALDRVPDGSSGGTAVAVAANFGAVGLGTDTGNSIRGPAAHTSLVGIRSTMGLTSRDGIVPLFLERDIGGPITRSVTTGRRFRRRQGSQRSLCRWDSRAGCSRPGCSYSAGRGANRR
jgi:Amidase